MRPGSRFPTFGRVAVCGLACSTLLTSCLSSGVQRENKRGPGEFDGGGGGIFLR